MTQMVCLKTLQIDIIMIKLKTLGIAGLIIVVSGCQTHKQEGSFSSISDFFKALGTGDISILKKYKKKQDSTEEEDWDESEVKE